MAAHGADASTALRSLQEKMNAYLTSAENGEEGDLGAVMAAAAVFQGELHEMSRSANERGVTWEERRRAGDERFI